jgi:DNA-binding transcriptional ArsR family regulator
MPAIPISDLFLDRMAEKFRILGDSTRLKILRSLMAGERAVSEVVEETGQGQANVSKHLKILAEAGFVSRRKSGLQVFYQISDPLVEQLCESVCTSIVEEARAEAKRNQKLLKEWGGGN